MHQFDWNRLNLHLFIDRELLSQRILNGLKSYESYCILGGRKTGKTTLLRKVEAGCTADLRPVYLTLQKAPPDFNLEWIFGEIKRPLKSEVAWSGDFVESMEALISPEREQGQIVVLLIDEVENLENSEWVGTFFDNLNHLLFSNPKTSRGLALVLAGGVFLDGSPKVSPCSPLLIRLTMAPLRLFNLAESQALCRLAGDGGAIDAATIEKLHVRTAGHPALLQYYLGRLESTAWHARLEDIDLQLQEDAAKLCESVFRCANESDLKVYAELANHELTMPSIPSKLRETRDSLSRLRFLGLIGRTNDELGRAGPQLFRKWFSSWLLPNTRDPIKALEADKEEDRFLEYKSTFSTDLFRYLTKGEVVRNNEVVQEVPLAVVGFLNADGGDILVGICEPKNDVQRSQLKDFPTLKSKVIVGLQLDFALFKGGWDETLNAFLGHLKEKVGPTVAGLLTFELFEMIGQSICLIRVPKGTKYFYYDHKFALRIHNRTQILSTEEAIDYQRESPRLG